MARILQTKKDNYLVKVTNAVIEIEESWSRCTPEGHKFKIAKNTKIWEWQDKTLSKIGKEFNVAFDDTLSPTQLRDLELIILTDS